MERAGGPPVPIPIKSYQSTYKNFAIVDTLNRKRLFKDGKFDVFSTEMAAWVDSNYVYTNKPNPKVIIAAQGTGKAQEFASEDVKKE